ncbi:hypothetical protein B0181_06190 [Moraxella caviae]|uniref:Multidrug resistance efflux transporter family protein n=1 Tax=Moraxella caviae TaxID=34060 RepID=A0A1T0A2P2_9GAMM|nr:multidrug resistance efflux transporter family protein [Moraxella caviae]OOR89561.1 hypothetical protein B0181_06190 [Moraxella caviae]STZ10240.1 Uncharacterised protein [Moraxella caviae]
MLRLIFIGLLAALFFSTTFVLNEMIAKSGGHWFWSASGRYIFMWLLLSVIILLRRGGWANLCGLVRLFFTHIKFWGVAGGIGFGGFYAFLCFGAEHAPGWIIAATFQSTVVASLLVLAVFGERIRLPVLFASLLIFLGVAIANIGEGARSSTSTNLSELLLFGALPALMAGFCFPIGNQLAWYAKNPMPRLSRHAIGKHIPAIRSPLLNNPLHIVWLLTTGSLPLWAVLGGIVMPSLPDGAQIINTFLVALFAGVIATSVFLYARSHATTSAQIAAVDATQAGEMIFAIIGSALLLGTALPSLLSGAGLVMVVVGLAWFAKMQEH